MLIINNTITWLQIKIICIKIVVILIYAQDDKMTFHRKTVVVVRWNIPRGKGAGCRYTRNYCNRKTYTVIKVY